MESQAEGELRQPGSQRSGCAEAPTNAYDQADWSEGLRKKKSAGVPDMTLLSTITNDEINKNLKARFTNQEIYVRVLCPLLVRADVRQTYIAHVLISVNPFRGKLSRVAPC